MQASSKTMAAGIIALAMAAGGAQAQEAMTTAGATGATGAPLPDVAADATPTQQRSIVAATPEDTSVQIQRWFAESPRAAEDEDGQLLDLRRDRQVHGEVGVSIGTGGYRSAYVTSVMPLGENGTLALSFGQEKNGRSYYGGPYGYRYGGPPVGYGPPGYGPGYGTVW